MAKLKKLGMFKALANKVYSIALTMTTLLHQIYLQKS
jgi:hypothetical protein